MPTHDQVVVEIALDPEARNKLLTDLDRMAFKAACLRRDLELAVKLKEKLDELVEAGP